MTKLLRLPRQSEGFRRLGIAVGVLAGLFWNRIFWPEYPLSLRADPGPFVFMALAFFFLGRFAVYGAYWVYVGFQTDRKGGAR